MYGIVFNYMYKGKLKKISDVKNFIYFGKWDYVSIIYLVCKVDDDDFILILNIFENYVEVNLIEKLI